MLLWNEYTIFYTNHLVLFHSSMNLSHMLKIFLCIEELVEELLNLTWAIHSGDANNWYCLYAFSYVISASVVLCMFLNSFLSWTMNASIFNIYQTVFKLYWKSLCAHNFWPYSSLLFFSFLFTRIYFRGCWVRHILLDMKLLIYFLFML